MEDEKDKSNNEYIIFLQNEKETYIKAIVRENRKKKFKLALMILLASFTFSLVWNFFSVKSQIEGTNIRLDALIELATVNEETSNEELRWREVSIKRDLNNFYNFISSEDIDKTYFTGAFDREHYIYVDSEHMNLLNELNLNKLNLMNMKENLNFVLGYSKDDAGYGALFFTALFLLLSISYFNRRNLKDYTQEVKRLEVELELTQLDINSNEKRAEKLFKLHQLEVEKYYSRTLYHTSYIFWIGCTCLVFGFMFIFVFVFFKMDETMISALGITSGFLTNFIGAFYFKMYSESVKSVNEFHSRLVNTHHLHFANLLANKIVDQGKREEAFEKMSENLSHIGE